MNTLGSGLNSLKNAGAQPERTWHADIALNYSRRPDGSVALHFDHSGPMRILQTLYPEGPQVAHNVLVHPPGGLCAGDVLSVRVNVGEAAHALVTTPGATRWYRRRDVHDALARQSVNIHLQKNAKLEWLPLENIAYTDSWARNELTFDLAAGAQLMGWDVCALGLQASGEPFERGCFSQKLHWPGHWLDECRVRADDVLLRQSRLGLNGNDVWATLWLAAADGFDRSQLETVIDASRTALKDHALSWGVTQPGPKIIVLRCVAQQVEPCMQALQMVRDLWRAQLWGMGVVAPRIWNT
jgi:urease accessory protein